MEIKMYSLDKILENGETIVLGLVATFILNSYFVIPCSWAIVYLLMG